MCFRAFCFLSYISYISVAALHKGGLWTSVLTIVGLSALIGVVAVFPADLKGTDAEEVNTKIYTGSAMLTGAHSPFQGA